MQNKKGFVIPLLVAIVAILAIGGGFYYVKKNKIAEALPPINNATSTIVGNDRDAHGCIGSAGYSWCEVKNKCLRVWEEKCEATSVERCFSVQGSILQISLSS